MKIFETKPYKFEIIIKYLKTIQKIKRQPISEVQFIHKFLKARICNFGTLVITQNKNFITLSPIFMKQQPL